jgi:acetate kinase
METILVVNAGSSSLKFQVFAIDGSQDLDCLVRGQIDGVGKRPRMCAAAGDGAALIDKAFAPDEILDLEAAIFEAGAWLRETQKVDLVAVGHRVVHGGPDFDAPVRVDRDVIARLERYISLAPLHQPHNLAPIGVVGGAISHGVAGLFLGPIILAVAWELFSTRADSDASISPNPRLKTEGVSDL